MLSNLDDDAWNDSIILEIYQETVKSHKTKGSKYKKRKIDIKSLPAGEPGKWESCMSVNSLPQIENEKSKDDGQIVDTGLGEFHQSSISSGNIVNQIESPSKKLLNESLEKMMVNIHFDAFTSTNLKINEIILKYI